jgi:ribose-phosphate pyrophosphokinase
MIVDSDNYAAAGIETLFFPGGEPHAKIPPEMTGSVLLFLKLRSWNDVGFAACVMDALRRNANVGPLNAFIPYFPGARQDRSDGHAPLTAYLMSKLLATRARTTVFDLHSEATYFIGDIAARLMPSDMDIPGRPGVAGVIAPDEGAVDRAEDFRAYFYPNVPLIRCSKKRDPVTGRLSGYHMPSLAAAGEYIIVDDICDGGGTFNLLAEAFGADPTGSHSLLSMFVSHGIFSKGLDAIDPRIAHIITTDSWCRLPSSDRLTVLPLLPALTARIGV